MNNKKLTDPAIVDFKALKILLANREDILSWSYGEVTKPETINYRSLRPEKDGLFDERIFGPTKDWECYCGKYKRIRYKGIVCDKCGVEVTLSRVRRERMGHINISSLVVHVWFFKGSSSPLSLILDISQKNLESVIYYASYLVTDIDKKKKEGAIGNLERTIKKRLKIEEEKFNANLKLALDEIKAKKIQAKKVKVSDEQKELVLEEMSLLERQKRVSLEEKYEINKKTIIEIFDTLVKLLKGLKIGSILSEDECIKLSEYDISMFFSVKTGAEALFDVLKKLDMDSLILQLRKEAHRSTGAKYLKIVRRLRLIESMRKAGIMPSSIIMSVLPVIPPDLRPMVQLVGGRFATSDLNDLYRRVINRNNRLKHLVSLGAPEIILRNEKRMLQESIDALIDSSQRANQIIGIPLRSLSDMLRGKQGRFRQNLLGKRVDYSGRSVIVVGPQLNLYECGLPKEMALEMFKPFVLREIIVRGFAPNIKSAKRFIEKRPPEIFDILEEITRKHPVLLNRAPTLHKLGIQAFYPILTEGSAISLHPCVCVGYGADFDGDQMAVHIPLSKKAQEEAINLMMPDHNLLKPADGTPITLPNKEMALGTYYLTEIDESLTKDNMPVFYGIKEAMLAYQFKKISLREKIKARVEGNLVETTCGRLIFNEKLPKALGFINEPIKASTIRNIVTKALNLYSYADVASIIDNIKSLGFYAATISGISVSIFDNKIISNKQDLIREANKKVYKIEEDYQEGLITIGEKKRLSNNVWLETTDTVADLTWNQITEKNAIRMIINSEGARAGKEQLKQLSAMRGLLLDPLGNIIELPIKSNFREGLSIFEYVASARGSRKGLTDSSLKTANAGYLTRRLVDSSHDVIVMADDCGTADGIIIKKTDKDRSTSFADRIIGRILLKDIVSKKNRKISVKKNEEITEEKAKVISESDIEGISVRSPMTCALSYGVCAKCYGWDFAVRKKVELGVPVGVIAAQSIGEPGTQLTMRVKHFGGVVMSDVTQGLPRVEELFEMRTPKNFSPVSEITGKVHIEIIDDGYKIMIKSVKLKPIEEREYFVPLAAELKVKEGDEIRSGEALAEGYLDPKEIIKAKGLLSAEEYIIKEAQKVYESQGIGINDKHFEVILRKMSDKVIVETIGDTSLVPGDFITKSKFETINKEVLSQGGEPATARQTIVGITKAALFSDSWLSASSFQETTKVLTEAALKGEQDNLIGLKENVIIGRLIPVEGKLSEEI